MHLDTVLVTLAIFQIAKIDWSSSAVLDDFVAYDFSTGDVSSYANEKLALVVGQKTDDGLSIPVMAQSIII